MQLIAIWIYGISLMWQSGIVAKWRCGKGTREIRNLLWGDCGRGEINKFLFIWRVGRGPCNS